MASTLHSLLGLDKSNPLFEILFNPEIPDELLVHFGMKFLEKVPRNSFPEKLLIARLFNAGFNRRNLRETFGYAIKTMRSWGEKLRSGDRDKISSIAEGQGTKKKLTNERKAYSNCSEIIHQNILARKKKRFLHFLPK